MAWAQWDAQYFGRKNIVRAENYAHFHAGYRKQRAHFDNLTLGVSALPDAGADELPFYAELAGRGDYYREHRRLLIYEKSSEHARGYIFTGPLTHLNLFEQILNYYWDRAGRECQPNYRDPFFRARAAQGIFWDMLRNNDINRAFEALTRLFTVANPNFVPVAPRTQKQELAKHNFSRTEIDSCSGRVWDIQKSWLEDFLFRFDYHKVFLAACPEIKLISLPRRIEGGQYYFIDRASAGNITLHRANIRPPALGDSFQFLALKARSGHFHPVSPSKARIFSWYEHVLPKILTRLGLGLEKVILPETTEPGATGWEIKSGLVEFARRPLVLF